MLIINYFNNTFSIFNSHKLYFLWFCTGIIIYSLSPHSSAIIFNIKDQYDGELIGVFDTKSTMWDYINESYDEIGDILINAPLVIENVLKKIGDLNKFGDQFPDTPQIHPIDRTDLIYQADDKMESENEVSYAGAMTILDTLDIGSINYYHFFISVQPTGLGSNEGFYTIEGHYSYPKKGDEASSIRSLEKERDQKEKALDNEPVSSRTRSKSKIHNPVFFELVPKTRYRKTFSQLVDVNRSKLPSIPVIESDMGISSNPVQNTATDIVIKTEQLFPSGKTLN